MSTTVSCKTVGNQFPTALRVLILMQTLYTTVMIATGTGDNLWQEFLFLALLDYQRYFGTLLVGNDLIVYWC